MFNALNAIAAQAGFRAKAIDSTVDAKFLSRGGGLTGAVNSKNGTVSFWIFTRTLASSRVIMRIEEGGSERLNMTVGASDQVFFIGNDTDDSVALQMNSTTDITQSAWNHVMASWDLGNTDTHLYLNGNEDKTGVAANDLAIGLGDSDEVFFFTNSDPTANEWNDDVAEFWFDDNFIDLSVQANREKFLLNGRPVFLGNNGEVPNGGSPLIFLSGLTAGWATNKGTGGGMTENESIVA